MLLLLFIVVVAVTVAIAVAVVVAAVAVAVVIYCCLTTLLRTDAGSSNRFVSEWGLLSLLLVFRYSTMLL